MNALAGDHEQIRQLVIDPNTAPAERVKLVQQLHTIENTIRMFTDPARSVPQQAAHAAGAPSPPISGPQGASPSQGPTQTATNPKTGQKLGLVNGQWVPISSRETGTGTGNDPLAEARDAIARGADPAAVKRRLLEHSIDPSGL